MAEKIMFKDQTQAPKSRPRPEVKQVAQLPGGLPLPPSKQTAVPSSRSSSETKTSSNPTKSVASLNSGERSMPKDLFGLPEFKFPIASQLKTTVVQSCADFSSIKSPTHLPRISNLMVPNLLGSFSSSAGGKKQTSLSNPPDLKSVLDEKIRNEFVSVVEDSISKISVKRPTDLSLFGPDERAKPVKPSAVESILESHSYAISSAQGASASFEHAETSANVGSSEPQDFNLGAKRSSDPTPTMSQPEICAEIKRTSESMPTIAQHPVVHKKSTFIKNKVKSVMRRLGFKKFGKEDEEESTGLMFGNEDMETERRSETRPEDDKRAKPFPTKTYNHLLDRDPILNNKEVETKCRIVYNVPCDSPAESVLSGSSKGSSSKSDSFITSPDETYVEESTSKSCPVTPAAERTSGSTPKSLSIERPPKSSPVSLDIEQRSKSSPDEEYASKSNPVSPSIERESKGNHE